MFLLSLAASEPTILNQVFSNKTVRLYFRVVVGGEPLSPRKRLTSAPFAFNAQYLMGVAATSTASSSQYIPISDDNGYFNFSRIGINSSTPGVSLASSGTAYFALNANDRVIVDGSTINNTPATAGGVVEVNYDPTVNSTAGVAATINVDSATANAVGGFFANVTGYSGGHSSDNQINAFMANLSGDDNDTDVNYIGYNAYAFNSNGGTNTARAFNAGTGYDQLLWSESGDIWFDNYNPTILTNGGSITIDGDLGLNLNTTNNANITVGSGRTSITGSLGVSSTVEIAGNLNASSTVSLATTTVDGNLTVSGNGTSSTFSDGLQTDSFAVTGSASSTFANGIVINGGCIFYQGTCLSAASNLWEAGTNGTYEDGAAVIVGSDALFTYANGGTGDLRVADEFESIGTAYFASGVQASSTLLVDGDTTLNSQLTVGATSTLASTTISGDVTVDTDTLVVDSINDRVGINTSTPGRSFALNGDALFNGDSYFALGTTNRIYVDGTTVTSTSGGNGLVYSDLKTETNSSVGIYSNVQIASSTTNGVGAFAANITGNAAGHSLGNSFSGFYSILNGDNDDTDVTYSGFSAVNFNGNGGTSVSRAFEAGTNWDYLLYGESGDIQFFGYDATINANSGSISLEGDNGLNLNTTFNAGITAGTGLFNITGSLGVSSTAEIAGNLTASGTVSLATTTVAASLDVNSNVASSTFSGGLEADTFAVTGSNTSTFANGISLSAGCFLYNGSCLTAANNLWETGSNGTYEDGAAVIVGSDALFTYADGGTGDLRVADEFESIGTAYFASDVQASSTLLVDGNATLNSQLSVAATSTLASTTVTGRLGVNTSTPGRSFAVSGASLFSLGSSDQVYIDASSTSVNPPTTEGALFVDYRASTNQTAGITSEVQVDDKNATFLGGFYSNVKGQTFTGHSAGNDISGYLSSLTGSAGDTSVLYNVLRAFAFEGNGGTSTSTVVRSGNNFDHVLFAESGNIWFDNYNAEILADGGSLTLDADQGLRLNTTNNANVTIGTGRTTITGSLGVTSTLEVGGDTTLDGQLTVTATSTLASTTVTGDVTVDTDTLVVDSINDRVGINTSTPISDFAVSGTSTLAGVVNVTGRSNNPFVAGAYTSSVEMSGPNAVYVSGDYAYVADQTEDGLVILDISDPVHPTFVSAVTSTAFMDVAYDVAVQGNYAYLVSFGDHSLNVIDVSDPAAPELISNTQSTSLMTSAQQVAVSGNYAYVSGGSLGTAIVVLDISDPVNPVIIGSVSSAGLDSARGGLAVSGKYLYATSEDTDRFYIIDIEDPSNPAVVGTLTDNTQLNGAFGLDIQGKYAYVATDLRDSLVIIDITSSTNPTIVGEIQDSTNLDVALGVTVAGDYAYVSAALGAGNDVLNIINIASSTQPFIESTIADANFSGPSAPFVSGNYVYLGGSGSDTLSVIDVSGAKISNASIGSAKATSLQVLGSALFDRNLDIRGGLSVGGSGLLLSGGFGMSVSTTASDNIFSVQNKGTNIFSMLGNGNIGINSSSPSNALAIQLPSSGDIVGQGISIYRDGGFYNMGQGTAHTSNFLPILKAKPKGDVGFFIRGIQSDSQVNADTLRFSAANNTESGAIPDADTAFSFYNWSDNLMTVLGNGNVGFGAAAPDYRLTVLNSSGDNTAPFGLQDADVSHGMTSLFSSANTYAQWSWFSSVDGGFQLRGGTDADQVAAALIGTQGVTSPTKPAVLIQGTKKDGTGQQSLSGDEIVLRVTGDAVAGNTGVLEVQADGDTDINGGLNVDSGTLFVDQTNNFVGVNSSTPGSSFSASGTSYFALGANDQVYIDGTSINNTPAPANGVLHVDYGATADSTGAVGADVTIEGASTNAVGGFFSQVTGNTSGLSNGNLINGFMANIIGDNDDSNVTYAAYTAFPFNGNGGTSESRALNVGTGWDYLLYGESGDIQFYQYDATINANSGSISLEGDNGLNLNTTANAGITAGTGLFNITGSLGVTSTLEVDGGTLYVDAGNNKVGIGTTTPGSALVINSNEGTASNNVFEVHSDVLGADDLVLRVEADGGVFSDNAYTSTGADYAEYFYTLDTDLQPGETVCVDIANENAVRRCLFPSDGNVMGIVSSRPSIIGNSSDEKRNDSHHVVVGMIGQVPAKVSDENGPIRVGDSLTSASVPGYAMRANAGDPTVGVALQKLESGSGNHSSTHFSQK